MEVSWRFREPSGKSGRFDLLLAKPGGVRDRQRAGKELAGKSIPPHTLWISASWNQETLSIAETPEAQGQVSAERARAQHSVSAVCSGLQTLLCFTDLKPEGRGVEAMPQGELQVPTPVAGPALPPSPMHCSGLVTPSL